jgi:hypothetical protein
MRTPPFLALLVVATVVGFCVGSVQAQQASAAGLDNAEELAKRSSRRNLLSSGCTRFVRVLATKSVQRLAGVVLNCFVWQT